MTTYTRTHKQSWRIHVLTNLAGWAVAFAIVFTLLSLFGEQLESLPHALNALIFTGVMVPLMGMTMPHIQAAVVRIVLAKRK